MSLKTIVILLVSLGILSAVLFLPCACIPDPRSLGAGPTVFTASHLKEVAVAIHSYREKHGVLPPAVVNDKNGNPLYSWRVLLLPHLEQHGLYHDFRIDEPWDSPSNKKLLSQMPEVFTTYGGQEFDGMTRFQVFVGPGTAFERPGLKIDDFPDGLADTILVVEASKPVPWSKPVDLKYDPKGPIPSLGGVSSKPVYCICYEVGRLQRFGTAFVDSSVAFMDSSIDEKTLRALITRNGGERVDMVKLGIRDYP